MGVLVTPGPGPVVSVRVNPSNKPMGLPVVVPEPLLPSNVLASDSRSDMRPAL